MAALALRWFIASSVILAWPVSLCADEPRTLNVRSPDTKNELSLAVDSGPDAVRFSIARAGQTVINPSPLRVTLAKSRSLERDAAILNVKEQAHDETVKLPWGKASTIRDRYAAASVRFKSGGIQWDLELRAYDDGVALRYGLPKQDGLDEFVIEDEATEFRMAGDPRVLFMVCNGFTTSHEAGYQSKRLSELPQGSLFEVPLLAVWGDGRAAAILEGRLRNFAGMYLERTDDKVPALRTRLAPLPANAKAVVKGRTPHSSPWRVILMADQAGKLIESNLPVALNEPAKGDFSWAKPGKTTWHWWNGTAEEGLLFKEGMNFDTHKRYIDFCAKHGITYHAVVADDKPWYVQSNAGYGPGPDTDILTPRRELELPRILNYAREKGVGIRLWVHWQPLSKKLEEAFAKYEQWGIKGLMVDFLDRNDQEMVEFNDRVLEAAARHKLHIQFHGSYPPSGEQRTFPNLFNREGVLNLEYLKWSDACSPPHNVNVAYTRLLAGPLDYHLGGFRAAPRAAFKPRNENPFVLGTRCHHLAMYVVYENPMPMVCDAPSAYEGQKGFDFLADVPTTWDESRFVAGEAGEYIVVARRNGKDWYLGGMTNWTPRKLDVPLKFLGRGEYRATLYVDGSAGDDDPNSIRMDRRTVNAETRAAVALASGGGFVAIVRPK